MMRRRLSEIFPRTAPAFGAVCGLMVIVFLGCGGESDAPVPGAPGAHEAGQNDSTAVEETLALVNTVVEKSNALLDSLRAIQTAQEADEFQSTFSAKIQELGDAYEAFAKRVRSLAPEQLAEVNSRRKTPESKPVAEVDIRGEAGRIGTIPGASTSFFWGAASDFRVRMQKIDDQYQVDEAMYAASLHGKGVTVKCWGSGRWSHAAVCEKLREFDRGETRSETGVVRLAHVEDFDALVAAVKERVGNVDLAHEGLREIGVWVDPAKIPVKSIAEVAAEAKAKADSSSAVPGFNDSPPPGFGSAPDTSASNPFEPGNAATDKPASNPFEPGNAAPKSSASNPFEPGNAAPDKSASNPFEPGGAAPKSSASNPFKPENAPSGARSGAPGGFGSGPSGGFGSGRPPGLGGLSGRMGMGGRMGPHVDLETQDPDELVEIAKGGDRWRRRAALRNLAAADPSKASKETKKAVCLALKAIAFEGQADEETRALAVEGMGLWAGRYAAPQLLQLLKHSGDGFFHRELHGTILRVLGELKHPDTLEPLVLGFADGSFNSDAAAECLIQFGPEVEPLVLKHCRPGDTEHSKRVVYILFKVGTARSLPALRALSNGHEGFFLREEIAQATEAIKKRRKTQAKE